MIFSILMPCFLFPLCRVVSGSRDATLRVWDIETGQCLHVLMGHVAAVRCVQYDGRRVVSGAYDFMVKVWDPETETCLHTLQGHTNRVYSLQVRICLSHRFHALLKAQSVTAKLLFICTLLARRKHKFQKHLTVLTSLIHFLSKMQMFVLKPDTSGL